MQARIPNCELREIEHAGCVPHWDAPEAVAREINSALVPAASS
jgi:pimeloyl-ACP methyl ester carboxylesterase